MPVPVYPLGVWNGRPLAWSPDLTPFSDNRLPDAVVLTTSLAGMAQDHSNSSFGDSVFFKGLCNFRLLVLKVRLTPQPLSNVIKEDAEGIRIENSSLHCKHYIIF
ncbi:UNVERIFIED_CONTAM: hypothetical protein NCL1_52817 [Trichonephila clavipes]